MSAAESPTTLESKLEALQCHFTWDIDPGESKLYHLRDKLEDIGTEEGNIWLGHIYNLRGFIQYKLGFTEDAQSLFNRAAEAFLQTREPHTDEGPWLVVNYGNLAWLHHHLNNQAESQAYLSRVEALMDEHPPPSQDELHPEIYAEKAWTLMKFGKDKKHLAEDCFERAIRMQPDRVEWNSSYVIGLVKASINCYTGVEADMLGKMRITKEQDPNNLYLAVHYIEQCAKKGERIDKDETRELARKVLRNPVSSYSGLKAILRVYRKYLSVDEAIDLAEKAVRNHPDVRYVKRCLALCYKWKIIFFSDSRPNQSTIDRAICLHEEVISLYPHSSLVKKIDLANIYAKSDNGNVRAEHMYQELLESVLEPADKQLKSKLEALQCHFTWGIHPSRSQLYRLRDKLEDIGTEEGNSWLGHIYNLRGFIQYKLGFTEDAQSLFNRAAEAFLQTREPHTDEGPWLVVNYGNLAWLHHHLNNQAESQAYLSRVEALMDEHPPPSQDELHPEIYAEKAWTLMKFGKDKQHLAEDCFERAIRMQPDRVEWNSSYVIGLVKASVNCYTQVEADMLEKMKMAKEQDPDNLYLAVQYLDQCAKNGERIDKDEARELARKVLSNSVSSYSGLKTLLWVYREYLSVDEAIDLAEEALENHPDVRYVKSCHALCYKWKILYSKGTRPNQSMIDKAISLHEEVVSLYLHSSLMKKISLANINAKSIHSHATAEQMYQELLESDLEPADKQLLYNHYAKYLNCNRHDGNGSIKYHMKAAEIPHQSFFRDSSIKILKKIRDNGKNKMCGEIGEFLANLQEP